MKNKNFFYKSIILLGFVLFIAACNNYGEKLKFNGATLYYKSPVTLEDANKLGEYLVETDFFDGTPKTLQLNKNDTAWVLKIIINPGTEEDKETIDVVNQFSKELSYNIFENKPVEIHLCNKKFKTIKIIVAV